MIDGFAPGNIADVREIDIGRDLEDFSVQPPVDDLDPRRDVAEDLSDGAGIGNGSGVGARLIDIIRTRFARSSTRMGRDADGSTRRVRLTQSSPKSAPAISEISAS